METLKNKFETMHKEEYEKLKVEVSKTLQECINRVNYVLENHPELILPASINIGMSLSCNWDILTIYALYEDYLSIFYKTIPFPKQYVKDAICFSRKSKSKHEGQTTFYTLLEKEGLELKKIYLKSDLYTNIWGVVWPKQD